MQPDEVLEFWFADSRDSVAAASGRMDVWFGSSPELDAEITERFSATITAGAEGELSDWAATAQGCLALILVLDQFPRNVYRGTAQAFAHDSLAFGLTLIGQRMRMLPELTPVEQLFFLMPYQHTEDLARQQEGVAAFHRLAESVPAEWRELVSGCRDFAQLHCDLIERFGRFPHRNAVLGRRSTPEELEYLENGESFGQG